MEQIWKRGNYNIYFFELSSFCRDKDFSRDELRSYIEESGMEHLLNFEEIRQVDYGRFGGIDNSWWRTMPVVYPKNQADVAALAEELQKIVITKK